MSLNVKRAKLGIILSILLVALEAVSVKSSPFLPSTRHFTVRGGGAFGRKSSVPSASILVDDFVSQLDGKFRHALDTGVPTQVTYGFVAGYCSGFALKRVGQSAAVVFGLGFVTLQTLSYTGFIEIRHDKFKSVVENFLDLNKDGRVNKTDLKRYFDKLMGVLTYNLPSGAGFAGGFLGGIRS